MHPFGGHIDTDLFTIIDEMHSRRGESRRPYEGEGRWKEVLFVCTHNAGRSQPLAERKARELLAAHAGVLPA